ncbi:WAP four-disulfide core domain protein 3 isoform X1 [Biomphalaria glabrata]|uniref:Antistasin-like domain-containing protein n=1 Tax=Biomphalaria glabrata TaxID=6526 RepID=A0A2C9L2U4_BIOGL|nr:WAP four-disulfide core domain protein 3 isoform X1 [Biomphalaria glabrata]
MKRFFKLLLFSFLFAASTASPASRIGLCWELCRTDQSTETSIPTCPEGYQCQSNGCGHECYPIQQVKRACPLYQCALYCPGGNRLSPEGCPLCSCRPLYYPNKPVTTEV